MNNLTNKLIPELRFPEFLNDGEWNERVLETIGKTISGLSGKSGDDFGEGKPFVTYKQVFDKAYVDFTQCGKVKISDGENQNELQRGDILFTTSSETPNEVGYASVVINSPSKPTYLNSFCFSFRPENLDNLLPDFSMYLFHSPIYRKSISVLAQGSTRYNISKGSFLNLKLPLPNPKEQQKIASCLSSLDEIITTHTNKLETLKIYKKGLMQNLFPQKGEKVPKLRFKEFEMDGEWEEKSVIDVANYVNGKAHEQDIIESGKYIVVNSKFISTNGEVKKFTNKPFCLAYKNDILMVLSDVPNGRAIAKCFYIDKDDFYSVNQRICKISPFDIDSKLLFYLLNRNKFFLSFDDGVKQTNLRNEDVQNCILIVPKNPTEQQKIAESLSSLDELIKEQSNKIEQLKSHKKGLMQGLFPKI